MNESRIERVLQNMHDHGTDPEGRGDEDGV